MQHPLCQSLGRLQALPQALFALVLGYSNVPLRAAKVLPMGGQLASTFGDVSGAKEVRRFRLHLHVFLFALVVRRI